MKKVRLCHRMVLAFEKVIINEIEYFCLVCLVLKMRVVILSFRNKSHTNIKQLNLCKTDEAS